MTPAARVQAAIEVIDDFLTGRSGEMALTAWARRSRYAGSSDRAAVRDHVYDALRHLRSYAARGGGMSGRPIMIAALLSPLLFFAFATWRRLTCTGTQSGTVHYCKS